jgi:hypothetical protein
LEIWACLWILHKHTEDDAAVLLLHLLMRSKEWWGAIYKGFAGIRRASPTLCFCFCFFFFTFYFLLGQISSKRRNSKLQKISEKGSKVLKVFKLPQAARKG